MPPLTAFRRWRGLPCCPLSNAFETAPSSERVRIRQQDRQTDRSTVGVALGRPCSVQYPAPYPSSLKQLKCFVFLWAQGLRKGNEHPLAVWRSGDVVCRRNEVTVCRKRPVSTGMVHHLVCNYAN